MFERFTDGARRVVVHAQDEARARDHDYIGTEHLLLGLLPEGEGLAVQAISALGVSPEDLRASVDSIIGRGPGAAAGQIPFTPRAKKALELALREALQLGDQHLGTEHLLLGLIREDGGVAAQVLTAHGLTLLRTRQQVIQLLDAASAVEPDAGDLTSRLDSVLARLGRIEERLRHRVLRTC